MLLYWQIVFFGRYKGFKPDPQAENGTKEFARLAEFKGWDIGDADYNGASLYYRDHQVRAEGQTQTPVTAHNNAPTSGDNKRTSFSSKKLEEDLALLSLKTTKTRIPTAVPSESDAGVTINTPDASQTKTQARLDDNKKVATAAPSSDCDSDDGVPLETPKGSSETGSTRSSYFAKYPDFKFDPTLPPSIQFKKLANIRKWIEGSYVFRHQRAVLYEEEFTLHFGCNVNNLRAWQIVCNDMGIEQIPQSINKCKKAIVPHHVNIYDYVDWKFRDTIEQGNGKHYSNGTLKKFKTVEQLSVYSYKGNKVYPRATAKQNPMMRALLEPIASFR